jgi:rare lipoprotein A
MSYVVLGKRYQRLASSADYAAEGVASWYGKKFHGRLTASGERYDMYALTAAHRSLPLPTYVRVTNLDNAKSVVVRVNDRGPFHDNRLIDLSFAAAAKLDMLGSGTARVRVVAVSGTPEEAEDFRPASPVRTKATRPMLPYTPRPIVQVAPVAPLIAYLQVAAFSSYSAADRLSAELRPALREDVFIMKLSSDQLYRVRVGPFATSQGLQDTTEMLHARFLLDPVTVTH